MKDGSRIGYESGAGLLNRLGLSTLLPRKIAECAGKKQELNPLTLIFLAKKHYPAKTVLQLTDLLMEAGLIVKRLSPQERFNVLVGSFCFWW